MQTDEAFWPGPGSAASTVCSVQSAARSPQPALCGPQSTSYTDPRALTVINVAFLAVSVEAFSARKLGDQTRNGLSACQITYRTFLPSSYFDLSSDIHKPRNQTPPTLPRSRHATKSMRPSVSTGLRFPRLSSQTKWRKTVNGNTR